MAGWRLDQVITSELFGFETPFSLEIERLLDEQRLLVAKKQRTPKETTRLHELEKQLLDIPRETRSADNDAMAIIRRAAALLDKDSAKT